MNTHLDAAAQDRLYAACSNAIGEAGRSREALFLARLTLLLFAEIGDEDRGHAAIRAALRDLPEPSLSKD